MRALHLHLSAELDHPARRNAEELGRRQRVAVHEIEHLPPETAEARVPAGHDRDPPDEKGCIHHIEVELLRAAIVKHLRDVWVFHEAVAHPHGVEIVAEMSGLNALFGRDARHVLCRHMQEHDALMQHFVVLEIVQKRHRHHVEPAGHIDRGPGHAGLGVNLADEIG